MANQENSASFVITIGERLLRCAARAIASYNDQASEEFGVFVKGSSLEYSREEQPGGGILVRSLFPTPDFSANSKKVHGLFDIDQIVLGELKQVVGNLWQEFREHVARVENDPAKSGIAQNQIIVLADAWDPDCSYLLLPTLYCLWNLAQNVGDTQIDLILDISNFKEDDQITNQEALVYRLVTELEHRLDPNPKFTEDFLLDNLGFDLDLRFEATNYYLVSEKKEGEFFAKNHKEIEEIIYAFLLGIFDSEVRGDFDRHFSRETRRMERTFFSGFGSAGMVINPNKIMESCALEHNLELINSGILGEKELDRVLIQTTSEQIIANLGYSMTMLRELIKKPDFTLQGENPSSWKLFYTKLQIDYQTPLIDQVSSCTFVEDATAIYERITQKDLFGELEFLQHNANIKVKNVLEARKLLFENILLNSSLYPNLMANLKSVFMYLRNELALRQDAARQKASSLQNYDQLESALSDAKQRFEEHLSNAPLPPYWFKRIPECQLKNLIRKILSTIHILYFHKLDRIYEEIETLIIQCICNQYERVLSEFDSTLGEETSQLLKSLENQFDQGIDKLKELNEDLSRELTVVQSELFWNNEDNHFLFYPLTPAMVKGIYTQFKPKDSLIASKLLSEKTWFKEWVKAASPDLVASLRTLSQENFLSIRSFPLTYYIKQYLSDEMQRKQFPKTLKDFTNKVRSLLDYHWEPSNTYTPEAKRVALVSADGDEFWMPFFENQEDNWEQHLSSSPYIASFCVVNHGYSLKGLAKLFEHGKAKWEALSETEKIQYDIIPTKDKKPPKALAELLHDNVWRITYNWKYTRSDRKTPDFFEIVIDVDKKDYNNFVATPRHSGDWHLYAESDCSALDQIVRQLKMIHKGEKFNAFDEAGNVLKFVQSFISYRYDKETTLYTDYPRFPLETLWDRVGDCEDVAILCGAILARLGHRVALLLYHGNPAHLAFGVEASKNQQHFQVIKDPKYAHTYYYGEATNKSWLLGEIPENYQNTTPDFYRIFENTWGAGEKTDQTNNGGE